VSILPLPDLTPEPSQTPANESFHPAQAIHLSSLYAYAGRPGALKGVTFWLRVVARLIDTAVHYCVALCSGLLVGFMVAVAVRLQHASPAAFIRFGKGDSKLTLFVFALLGSVMLEIVCEGFHGSTLGKLIFGFVVVQEDGTPCRLGPAAIRSLAYFVDALFFGLIGYLAMQKTPQQQRHGDEWAHTVVCQRADVAPQDLRSFGHFVAVFLLAAMADAAFIILGVVINGLA
jgi:uncharacterized RDD family membrane protein YckC